MMNYEKKYKSLVEAVKTLKEANPSDEGIQNWVKDNVPELVESEDEKIRKALIDFVRHNERGGYRIYNNVSTASMIDYLERQRPINPTMIEKERIDNAFTKMMLKEQKPADKVEPKFKIKKDKWYVCTNTFVSRGKIIAIKGQTYQSQQEDDTITCEDNCLFIDKHDGKASDYFRYWTIQDAKDGDVLLSPSTPEGDKECPFIFKEIDKSGIVRFHVALLQSESIKTADGITNVMGYANAGYHTPATKEQCNLLFQKMKEAGYEWDATKKELKKIESKSAWSEEDEDMLNRLILHFDWTRNYCFDKSDCDAARNWLKSLRDRYTWKPSNEQIKAIRLARSFVVDDFEEHPILSEILMELEERLKKLKEE